jgi:glycosyltransferase involved in cell wall biosynthesis
MDHPNVVAVIPAYNEEKTIDKVVRNVLAVCNVIVVDDGSADDTKNISSMAGAVVLSNGVNRGYSYSITAGIKKAAELGFEFAVTLDADGQHNPQDIKKFLAELNKGVDLVVGKRNKMQRPAEGIASFIVNLIYGVKDPLCGMKAYRLDRFKNYSGLGGYDSIGTELMFVALKDKFKVTQVPIYCPVREDQNRFGSGLKPNLRILKAIWKGIFHKKSDSNSAYAKPSY